MSSEFHGDIGGKGKGQKSIQKKRGEKSSDGKTELRKKFSRRKRFSLDKKGSRHRQRNPSESSIYVDVEHAGMWRPTDDLRLIVNVTQVRKTKSYLWKLKLLYL